MKTIKTSLLAVAVVSAVTAVSATAASAHTWKKSDIPLKSALKFYSKQELRFSDSHVGEEIECPVVEEGTVGPGAVGEITKVSNVTGGKTIECRTLKGCESSRGVEVEAYSGLPWKTELVTLYEGLRNRITTTGALWKIKCEVDGLNLMGLCEVATSASIKNPASRAEEIYDGKAPTGSCTEGSSGGFRTEGGGVIEGFAGESLQAE